MKQRFEQSRCAKDSRQGCSVVNYSFQVTISKLTLSNSMTKKHFICALSSLALALLVVSCVAGPSPTQGNTRRGAALTSPQPNAIVGMWTKRQTGINNSLVVVETMLIKPGGTGINRFSRRGMVGGSSYNEQTFKLSWTYDGGGWWTLISEGASSGATSRFGWQTDGNVLFCTDKRGFLVDPIVWTRAEE